MQVNNNKQHNDNRPAVVSWDQ